MAFFYLRSVLVGKYGKIHFRIKEIRVIHDLCTDSQCDHSSSYFLKKVKEIAAAKFCLVHVLTNRVFDCAIGRGFIGTVCQPGLNIGLTTFKDDHVSINIQEQSFGSFDPI